MGSPQKPGIAQSDDDQVSIIRKEFFALAGDPFSAVILNQLLYWTLRVKDFDLYLKEERTQAECPDTFQYGWIYKTAADLSEETMLGLSKTTMRKYLKLLIDQGWVEERGNALERWKKTTQYRVNIRKLQWDLKGIGRQLPGVYLKGFSSVLEENQLHKPLKVAACDNNTSSTKSHLNDEEIQQTKNLSSETENLPSASKFLPSKESSSEPSLDGDEKIEEISKSKILPSESNFLSSESENLPPKSRNLSSKSKILPSYTYTENTTEITNREHTQRTCAREDFDKNFFKEILGAWKTCTAQGGRVPPIHLTEERKQRLQSVLETHFQNDLTQWQQFCERVSRSPFLMGQGARKWRVSLDWILMHENLLKVLEGNFDDPDGYDQKRAEQSGADRMKEISTILASIEDSMWKKWCSQLDLSCESRDAVSLWELKEIANARFLEVEDDRLVWVGSPDKQVLSRIEDLRLKILPIIQRSFPQARTVRTRVIVEELSLQPEAINFHLLSTNPIQQQGGIAYA
jgi:hypothetical protein